MPILRGAVSFARYRVEPSEAKDLKRVLARGLKTHAFVPIDPRSEDARAAGFVELENPESSEFAVSALYYGERALFSWRVDQIKIPGAQLKAELERWQREFEKEQGRKPARSEKAERKAALRQLMRSRAVPVSKTHDLAWNLKTGELQIWSASRKVIDEIVGAVETAFHARVIPQVPGAVAVESGMADAALKPSAELMGQAAMEVLDGAA